MRRILLTPALVLLLTMCSPFGVTSDAPAGSIADASGGADGGAEPADVGTADAPSTPDTGPCANAETFDGPTVPPPWKAIKNGAGTLDLGVAEQNRRFFRAGGASTADNVASFLSRDLAKGRPNIEVEARLPVAPLASPSAFVQLINIYCDGPPNTAVTVGLDNQGLFFHADDGTTQGHAPLGNMVPGDWVTFRIVVLGNQATLLVGTKPFSVMTMGKLADGGATCHVELGLQAQQAIPPLTADFDRFCER